jgi:hypothetical protein
VLTTRTFIDPPIWRNRSPRSSSTRCISLLPLRLFPPITITCHTFHSSRFELFFE